MAIARYSISIMRVLLLLVSSEEKRGQQTEKKALKLADVRTEIVALYKRKSFRTNKLQNDAV